MNANSWFTYVLHVSVIFVQYLLIFSSCPTVASLTHSWVWPACNKDRLQRDFHPKTARSVKRSSTSKECHQNWTKNKEQKEGQLLEDCEEDVLLRIFTGTIQSMMMNTLNFDWGIGFLTTDLYWQFLNFDHFMQSIGFLKRPYLMPQKEFLVLLAHRISLIDIPFDTIKTEKQSL